MTTNGGALIVASQLGDALNDALVARVPDLAILPIPAGVPRDVPPHAVALFARPNFGARDPQAHVRPPGWPHRLRWVQLISAGADGYPHWYFDGPIVTCARGPSAEPIAEYALAAIFAATKNFPALWVRAAADWRQQRVGNVAGTTLGIVGFGAIGQALARKAVPLGLRVLALRRTDAPFGIDGVQRAENLADLLAQSDHVVLAVPATAQTRQLINASTLAHAKPGLHLINVARGGLVETSALIAALERGTLGRVTLDATDPEPLPEHHPLYTHPGVFISPHSSMGTPDVVQRLADKLADNVIRFRGGAELADIVDLERGY
jgi:phosphoglycerate dehydrogenase-like enzyme